MSNDAELMSLTVGVSEAGRLLGVSADTIRRLIIDGDLPALRAGRGRKRGKVLIRREAIEAFIERREREGV